MKRLTEKFNSIAVKKGEMFEVEMQENANSGYIWEISVAEGKATLLAKDTQYVPSSDNDGGSLLYRFLFKADETGTIELKAQKVRSWEKQFPVAFKNFKIKVD